MGLALSNYFEYDGVAIMELSAEALEDAQVIACVTLNHENGLKDRSRPLFKCAENYTDPGCIYITDAVSPCWSTNGKQASARQCDYASDNSAGVDAGLFMINTWYQRKRITKLSGIDCTPKDTRNPKDTCNAKFIAWLHNLDNQIAIIKDLYRERGFQPWVAYNKHVAPYV